MDANCHIDHAVIDGGLSLAFLVMTLLCFGKVTLPPVDIGNLENSYSFARKKLCILLINVVSCVPRCNI